MAWTPIGVGSAENDGTGDKIRAAFQKVNLIVSTMWDTVTDGIAYLSGYVGINTSAPAHRFHVNEGDIYISGDTHSSTVSTDYDAFNNGIALVNSASVNNYCSLITGYQTGPWGGNIQFITRGDAGGTSEKAVILSNGNFGIGKTTPGSKLAVVGLPVYANNAAALAGGLTAGDIYQTSSTGDATLMITNAT